uniref:Uncharacterized protein n=1 Tax=Branchiostoma floridae TaxID=7739 RepID=C3XTV0_BRAFL|eukprot:XP_002612315.1 hypothetical protein BRAFLDRAFT_80069 [Branchiostoma floridae]
MLLDESVASDCSEAWSEPSGISFGLKGESSLRLVSVETSGNHSASRAKGFGVVVNRQKKLTSDHQIANSDNGRDQSWEKVACIGVSFDGKEARLKSGPTRRMGRADGAKCLAGRAVSNEDKMIERNAALMNVTARGPSTTGEGTDRSEDQIMFPPSNGNLNVQTQTNTTAGVVQTRGTDLTIPLVVTSVVASLSIVIGCHVLSCFLKSRRNDQNLGHHRQNLPFSSHALKVNPLYVRSGAQGSSQPGHMQGDQTDDSTYNAINEDEVYDPSGHYYSEIKDQDVGGRTTQTLGSEQQNDNTYNDINEDEVYDPSGHYYSEIKDEDINNEGRSVLRSEGPHEFDGIEEEHMELDGDDSLSPYMYAEQDSQSENSDDCGSLASYVVQSSHEIFEGKDDDSSSFCASEVGLSITDNVGAHALLYKVDTGTVASVNCALERSSVTKSADREQTTYGVSDCTDASNLTYICTPETAGNLTSVNMKECVREHSENIFETSELEKEAVEVDPNLGELGCRTDTQVGLKS